MRKHRTTVGAMALATQVFDIPTGNAIWASLPFAATAWTWGEEVLFSTP